MTTKRRIVRVGISFQLLVEMVKTDWVSRNGVRCIEGIPPDAEFISSYVSQVEDCAYLVFYHPIFAEVSEGDEIPRVHIVHRITKEGNLDQK